MSKVNIGIITYWWSKENYGQILQMYALQEYLRLNGYNPFLIKYDPSKDPDLINSKSNVSYLQKLFNPKAIIRFIKRKKSYKLRERERQYYPRYFDKFIKENIQESERVYNSIEELRRYPPKADIYITGSDVVWSSFRPAYYLDFGATNVKRISYAPSFGRGTVPEEELKKIKPFLEKFNLVTVREKQGVDICLKAGVSDAKFVLDPTFLLSAKNYKDISSESINKKDFCFLYLLGSETSLSSKEVFSKLNKNGLETIYATCERYDKYPKVYPTIYEWLEYYSKAKIIITNSYHGCIFAIIFKKDFIFLPLTGIHAPLNVRVTSLLSQLNLSERILDNNMDILLNTHVEYKKVNSVLDNMKKNIHHILINELNKSLTSK